MPEGDTVFRAARALHRALAGKIITRFETGYAKLASADDTYTIAGRAVEHVEARGKWLLMFLSGDLILLTHMLMNGSWHIYRMGERWRRPRRDMRIVIETSDWAAVGFTIPVAEFHTTASLKKKKGVMLGPDLLKPDFDHQQALERIRARPTEEIAVVLLNQHVLAGIGNVFKSEICFASAVHPFRTVESLTQSQLENIVDLSHKFLKINVAEDADGQVTANTGARRTMNSLDRSARLWVYGRRGEPCRRCGATILMHKQGTEARTTFWCPSCQSA
jgi:endonuclease-8